MKTVTYDEKTHAIVPICETNDMTSAMADVIDDPSNDRSAWDLAENVYQAAIKAAPPYQSEDVLNMVWIPLISAGQVKKGMKLRFKIGDKTYHEKAKLILNPGTSNEEVIYNIKQNYYFITSMVIAGHSSSKEVEFLAAPKVEELLIFLKNQVDIFGK